MFSNRNNKIITKILEGGDFQIGQPVLNQQPPINQLPMDQQPALNQPPLDQQPALNQLPMDQQPALNQPPINQPPALNQSPINQPPALNQPPLDQQPALNQLPMDQQPALNQLPMDQQPALNQLPMDQQPVLNQPSLDEQPVLNQPPALNQPLDQQPALNQLPMDQQPALNQLSMDQQPALNQLSMNQQPALNQLSMDQQPALNQLSMDQQPALNQLSMDQPSINQPFSNENYPNADYLYNKITSQNFVNNIKTYVCAFVINKDIDTHFVKYIVQHKDLYVTFPSFTFEQMSGFNPEPNPQQVIGQNGGFQDDSTGDENPLDTIFKTKVIEFVKTNIYSGLQFQSEPAYIGYIPNVSEQDSVFVFVKIDDAHNKHFISSSSDEYFESTPNELFHLFKVFNFDVEQQVKNLFSNNPWLYTEQSLASPFSGYLCKLEGSEIKNTAVGEEPGNFNINIDNIGDFFYFSFLPLDPNNAKMYQRYALLPMEYECILDNSNLEYYKQNMSLYQNSNSIYFKGEILSNKKEGNQFFAIRSPTQFAQF